jgi:AAA domain
MLSIKEYKDKLRAIGAKVTHANKHEYDVYYKTLEWYKTFPWRDEQTHVFDAINAHQNVVVQGIFGVGKSQMLIGIIFKALIEDGYKPSEIVYTAFNVCVKNEIRKKFSNFGIRNKIQVFTFDSLIYKICKLYGCPNLDQPNYEGRRKFVYNIITSNKNIIHDVFDAKLVVLDECQDLEIQALGVFKLFFPKAKFVFVGDVLQSIQKEPRESLLWQLMQHSKYDDFYKVYMYETPRVPVKILDALKHALSQFYPEFCQDLNKWVSKNTKTAGAIEWKQFKHFKQMFTDVLDFTKQHKIDETMILTFSSSVTVRGSLGDVSRIRNFLIENNIPVNLNHKRLEHDKLFLSTSNSSKGLERAHVLVILTFPLEQAFLNFSNDLVMNLITVAISRAIESVTIYVPISIQKFSPILQYYKAVPQPTCDTKSTHNLEKGKKGDTDVLVNVGFNMDNVMNKEHSVTEVLRLGVLKYETLSLVKSYATRIVQYKLSDAKIGIHLFTDEERTLAGIFVEHLITSELSNVWPTINISNLCDNPSYKHCMSKLDVLYKQYMGMTQQTSFASSSTEYQTRVLHIYSQLLLGMNHRIFVTLRESEVVKIQNMWKFHWKNAVHQLKPIGDNCKYSIQSNCKMSFITGIIDVMVTEDKGSFKNITFWEIKASSDPMWESDALSQVMLYVLMNAKSRCTVVLINPFRNSVIKYSVNIPCINTIRHVVMHDSVIYNANSLMAKTVCDTTKLNKCIDLLDTLFINVQDIEDSTHVTILNLFSPTKLNIVYHAVTKGEQTKLGLESTVTLEDALKKVELYTQNKKYVFDNRRDEEEYQGYMGEIFNTQVDGFNYCVGNVLNLFTKMRFIF